jgi:hypothetical protein
VLKLRAARLQQQAPMIAGAVGHTP